MAYLTNVEIFYEIANEAHAAMTQAMKEGRTLKPSGDGYVISFDPRATAFKQACVAVAFSGMFLEAAVYFVALSRFSKSKAERIDSLRSYPKKLEKLGITNETLIADSEALQRARRELAHEKAIKLGQSIKNPPTYAQDAAELAISVIRALRAELMSP